MSAVPRPPKKRADLTTDAMQRRRIEEESARSVGTHLSSPIGAGIDPERIEVMLGTEKED